MDRSQHPYGTRAGGIWRRFLLLAPLLVALVLCSRAYIRSVGATYEARVPFVHDGSVAPEDVMLGRTGVVEVVSVRQTERGRTIVTFHAVSEGDTDATLDSNDSLGAWELQVKDGVIIEGGTDFAGWESIHVSLCIFMGACAVLFASALAQLWRDSWYGYEMVACGGGLLFCLFQFAFFTASLFFGSLRSFSELASHITYMADWFVFVTLIPMAAAALLVTISNISLIRHEGLRPVNLLGIGASLVWALAAFVWMNMSGLFKAWAYTYHVLDIMDPIVSAGITFGECLLLSTILCGWLASRHEPNHGVDFLVILGCGLRKDGTPCPLLAGRVDRALDFDLQRTRAGDAPTTFVPSGGQGPDEVVSEAQSMGTYLAGKGVSPDRIVLEDRSTTTRENMAYSREVIERHAHHNAQDLRVAFSTTNYHVFRGYVCAHQAGLAMEGIGSRTRAYFWPNAFLREFAGLLAAQWRLIVQVYLILAAIYGVAAYALTLA